MTCYISIVQGLPRSQVVEETPKELSMEQKGGDMNLFRIDLKTVTSSKNLEG